MSGLRSTGLPIAVVAFAGLVGCAPNDVSVSIIEMEAVTRMNMCIAQSVMMGTQLPAITRGILDVDLDSRLNINYGYLAFPVVRNNLVTHTVGAAPNPVEVNSMSVSGANVSITLPPGVAAPAGVPLSYFYPSSAGHLDPGQTAPMMVEAVPQPLAAALGRSVPAGGRLTVVSSMSPVVVKQNETIVGAPATLPVDICNGCLEVFFNPPTCPYPMGATINSGGCFPQQDNFISCCNLATGGVHCGP